MNAAMPTRPRARRQMRAEQWPPTGKLAGVPTSRETDRLADLNCQEFSRLLVRVGGPHAVLEERDGALFCASSTPFPVLFNIAWRTDPDLDAATFVRRADEWFSSLGRGWSVMVRDQKIDDDLRAAVADAGLVALLDAPAMNISNVPERRDPPGGVDLRWVGDQSGFDDFVAVSDAAYAVNGLPAGTAPEGLRILGEFTAPNIHSVVAYDRGQPLAAAQVLLSHSIAGVYWVGTVPEGGRRGLGELVTRTVTRRAFDLGARFVTLQASSMGEPIYRRLGFEERFRYTTWARLGF